MNKTRSKQYEAIAEYSRKKGEKNYQAVLDAIDRAQAEGNLATNYVLKLAGIKSRTYFTNHLEARQALEAARKKHNTHLKKTKQSTNSRDVIIKSLQTQLKIKDKEIKKLKNEIALQENYKRKYEAAMSEIIEIKKQRDNAIINSGILDF